MKLSLLIKKFLTGEEIIKIDELITGNFGTVFQEPALNEIVSSIFRTEMMHYLVFKDNELVAYCAGHKQKKGLLTTIELKPLYDIPYGGFIINDEKCKLKEALSLLPKKNTIKYIYSTGPIISKSNEMAEFHKLRIMHTAIIDLSLSEIDIWKNIINSKKRNMIRKALKEGITIEKYDNEEGLKLFWPLLNDLHLNLGYDQLTFAYYAGLLNLYFRKNKAIVMLAKRLNDIISGVIIIGNRNIMHYYKSAGKRDVDSIGGRDLLQWEAIKYSKEYGAKYYDLCVVDKNKLPQIAKHKMGYSKELIPFYSFSQSNLYYKIANRIQNVF